jgi:hypothetical protein
VVPLASVTAAPVAASDFFVVAINNVLIVIQ